MAYASSLLCFGLVLFCVSTAHAGGPDFQSVVNKNGLSDRFPVFTVDTTKLYAVAGQERIIGGAFQPSAVMDSKGIIHLVFQARLDSSEDGTEKLIAYVTSTDGGKTYSEMRFINDVPMQSYALSIFTRQGPDGGERISILTCLAIDGEIKRYKDPEVIKHRLGIDVTTFKRRGASLVLEFYSDDGGETWARKEHRGICDRTYDRNGKSYHLSFTNLIGQVRTVAGGPYDGRLILGCDLRGDYVSDTSSDFRAYEQSSSIIFSDDDGESWQFGGVIPDETVFAHNESSAVSIENGKRLILVRRRRDRLTGDFKVMHYSTDGGASWGPGLESTIPARQCLQVLENYNDVILCSTPRKRNRTEGTIFVSRDSGQTWEQHLIEPGPFSYSTVNHLHEGHFICAYTLGHHGEEGIAARVFSFDWLSSSSDSKASDKPKTEGGKQTIVAFGDSTTAPRGSLRVYIDRLNEALSGKGMDVAAINAGIGGNTTQAARNRFQKDVLDLKPDVVIIQFGINDAAVDVWKDPPADRPRVSIENYSKNLEHFVDTLLERNCRVILMTPNCLRWTPEMKKKYGSPPYQSDDPDGFNVILRKYADCVRKIAERKNVPLVDVYEAFQAYAEKDGRRVEDLLLDGMHPNEHGHRLVAEMLLKEF